MGLQELEERYAAGFGKFYGLLAALGHAGNSILPKVAYHMDVYQIVLLRSVVLLVIAYFWNKDKQALWPKDPYTHNTMILRMLSGAFNMHTFNICVKLLPPTIVVIAVAFHAPLAALVPVFYGGKVSCLTLCVSCIAIIGVVLVVDPSLIGLGEGGAALFEVNFMTIIGCICAFFNTVSLVLEKLIFSGRSNIFLLFFRTLSSS